MSLHEKGAVTGVGETEYMRGTDRTPLSLQLEETFENIHRLAQDVPGADRFAIHGIETARVYFARAADRAMLVSAVSGWLPAAATVELFPAWICRAELLVEIEATIAPS